MKKGDHVKINVEGQSFDNEQGIVTNIEKEYDFPVLVTFKDDNNRIHSRYFKFDELEVIK